MQEQEEHHNSYLDDPEDFGLPEVDYDPVERENDTPPAFEQPNYYTDPDEEEEPNKSWIIAGVIGFFVLIGLAVYLFLFNGTEQIGALFSEKPMQPPVQEEVVEKQPEPVPEIEEPMPEPVVEVVPEVNPLAPYEGITTISEGTGRSYIVIASFVDADLAQDFSQKMVSQGVGVKIISPTNRSPLLHRVVVADFADFRQAMQEVEQFRAVYGDKAWVLKF